MSDDKKTTKPDDLSDKDLEKTESTETVDETTTVGADADDVITKFDIVFDDDSVDDTDNAADDTAGTTSTDDDNNAGEADKASDESADETSAKTNAKSEAKTTAADKPAAKPATVKPVEVVEAESTAKHIDREIRHRNEFKFKTYPTLAFKHVSYAPDRKGGDVLHDVSMEFYARKTHAVLVDAENERAAVMGLLSGLMRPTDGKVMFKSQELLELMPQEYRGHFVGMIPQRYALLPYLSAVQNIVMTMEASGRNFLKAKPILAAELLENVDFPDEKNDVPVSELLEIDRRKAAIARALACEPAVILADEPTGQLGDDGRDEVVKLLRSFTRKDDHCVVIVTEDRDLAKSCDYTYTL
ncbi:ABC transporter ATP-binding protein [Bifidobacterium callimiconis]|uniref:ATP-binding cassette domain-containing protein n=1 Tax=Bifidobacterium callimiconis TaxID=2306973 RepID=UPI001BDDC3AB|nr:ATP-binding cassette domain-containing protein [Bifidobacterium callimiconis]MBT1176895.1 ABC transporter ATP-binding protein [Bifidobacterium callimiconis]